MLKLQTAATAYDIEEVQCSDATLFWRTPDAVSHTVGEDVEVTTSDSQVIMGYVAAINEDSIDVSFS
jgi:hypothetical protein